MVIEEKYSGFKDAYLVLSFVMTLVSLSALYYSQKLTGLIGSVIVAHIFLTLLWLVVLILGIISIIRAQRYGFRTKWLGALVITGGLIFGGFSALFAVANHQFLKPERLSAGPLSSVDRESELQFIISPTTVRSGENIVLSINNTGSRVYHQRKLPSKYENFNFGLLTLDEQGNRVVGEYTDVVYAMEEDYYDKDIQPSGITPLGTFYLKECGHRPSFVCDFQDLVSLTPGRYRIYGEYEASDGYKTVIDTFVNIIP